MRTITTHRPSPLNDGLLIGVLDEPSHGGASHQYQIRKHVRNEDDATADVELVQIHFQCGPIKESGVNGISNEALLAIVLDRLESFQKGEYACLLNQFAVHYLMSALAALHARTQNRLNRNVEGTHEK